MHTMRNLDKFIQLLCGDFDNSKQIAMEKAQGKEIHPLSKHGIGVCNEKISNLPDDFSGYFVIEDSCFDMGDRQIIKNYLFLYEETESGDIRLSSYDIPQEIPKESFTYKNEELFIDYLKLKLSPRFSPLELREDMGEFSGSNVSRFSEDMLFYFGLRVTEDGFWVKELLEKEGVSIAGYKEPTMYKRIV